MRTAKIGDTEVTLNERDYRQLLKRFDTSKTVSYAGQIMTRTDGQCICDWNHSDIDDFPFCEKCPLGKARSIGCVNLLDAMCVKRKFHADYYGMKWPILNDSTARTQLNTIHSFLLRIPRT